MVATGDRRSPATRARRGSLFVAITVGPQFLGHTVFNYLLGHVRAPVVAIALLAEPVGATLLAFVLLDEMPERGSRSPAAR